MLLLIGIVLLSGKLQQVQLLMKFLYLIEIYKLAMQTVYCECVTDFSCHLLHAPLKHDRHFGLKQILFTKMYTVQVGIEGYLVLYNY